MNPHFMRQSEARDEHEANLFTQIAAARRARDAAENREQRIEHQNEIYALGEQIRLYRRKQDE